MFKIFFQQKSHFIMFINIDILFLFALKQLLKEVLFCPSYMYLDEDFFSPCRRRNSPEDTQTDKHTKGEDGLYSSQSQAGLAPSVAGQ